LIEWLGADRVVFASDWPHFDRDEPTEVASELPPALRDAVMGANARALLAP
jgi:predicted TIM-barrel fold metal-dependent hydrolase